MAVVMLHLKMNKNTIAVTNTTSAKTVTNMTLREIREK